ncbi:MAG: NADH-quinone oxidoreductase subunit NuoN [Kineosporiaceae bacterium]
MSPLLLPATATVDISFPEVDWFALSPMLVVAGAALLSVILEAALPRGTRRLPQIALTVAAPVAALVLLVVLAQEDVVTAGGALAIDGVTRFAQGLLLVLAVLGALLLADRMPDGEDAFAPQASAVPGSPAEDAVRRAGLVQTEVYPLFLITVLGMLVFPAANDLLTLFVALEVFSLPLYLMCGMARRRRLLSQEASLKYFLLGAFSSAFFLYGAALLYGYSGSLRLPDVEAAVRAGQGSDALLLAGIGLLVVGLLFKVSAVPFHSWTPDVYQGAPTPVTAFMSAATKVAAFVALLRVLYVAVPSARWDFQPALWAVAVVTMVLGSVIALAQGDVKRMLAYSSIAHAGFILTGVLALEAQGVSGSLFYLAAYGLTTIGAFAAVALVRDSAGEATRLSSWAGVGRRSPVFAAVFALFLLALAGIPLTSGFTGKFAVFSAAVAGGAEFLVVVGVLASAVAAFFYARVIALMYFSEPTESTATVAVPSPPLAVVLGVAVVATVVLGVVPGVLLEPAQDLGVFLAQ